MPEYLSPGVYVEELDRGPKPIEGVGTAMACFVGFTERAERVEQVDGGQETRSIVGKAQLVTNWSQYLESFGSFVDGAYLPLAVYGYFLNGGTRCYVVSVRTIPKAQAALLNGAGKGQLTVQAKVAGPDGAKLRVQIVDMPLALPDNKPADKGKATKEAAAKDEKPPEDAPPSVGAPSVGPQPFTIKVERQTASGGWRVQETIQDVTLAEMEVDGVKRVGLAYKNNRMPQFVDLMLPKETGKLADLWPKAQTQTLTIDTTAILPAATTDYVGSMAERTGIEGLEELDDVTMLVVPDLMMPLPGQKTVDLQTIKAVQTMMIAHCEKMHDRVAILDAPPNLSPQAVKKWRMDTAGFDSSYAAMYYPWIQVADPVTNKPLLIPPSGHVAGIWARNDAQRGVHKAPGNEVVRGATGLAVNCTKGEQDTLNPNGVNCIRSFPGMGIRVWGARTLSSNPSWRYINVRRLFNFVEKSIERGTQWVVFEPNDPFLWSRVQRDIGAFLNMVWSTGALFGLSADQAYYVKCDAELNPPNTRDLGMMICEIGICPVKPAEFVIFRISQWAAGA